MVRPSEFGCILVGPLRRTVACGTTTRQESWVTTRYRRPLKAYEVVLRHVEEAIPRRSASVGDLPPEQGLAQQLGVSRSATREAIRALEAQGCSPLGRRRSG